MTSKLDITLMPPRPPCPPLTQKQGLPWQCSVCKLLLLQTHWQTPGQQSSRAEVQLKGTCLPLQSCPLLQHFCWQSVFDNISELFLTDSSGGWPSWHRLRLADVLVFTWLPVLEECLHASTCCTVPIVFSWHRAMLGVTLSAFLQ